MENNDSLSRFHPLVREWFLKKFGSPTDIQAKSWPLIADGRHVLITAPTGSGKTLAAFLWAINMLASGKWKSGGLRVLYISPLKALNNDIRENLKEPLDGLRTFFEEKGESFPEIEALVRSGDTPQNLRRRMLTHPPEILITTPESLNIILSSPRASMILTGIETVIMDEIHALVSDKRGTHMISAIERLTLASGEFQRIALSATIKPLERTAEFVGGFKQNKNGGYAARDVVIVQSETEKKIEVSVRQAAKDDAESIFPTLIRDLKTRIASNRATLIFTNSRRMCEKIAQLINETENDVIAYSHHGSLSRELRLYVERLLKAGKLKAIVATSSLELGIDIGSVDEVILIESPSSVSSGLQRIGRAGHAVGETSRGIIFPVHSLDLLNTVIVAKSIIERDIEETQIPENTLDVLAQIILSMTSIDPWDKDNLYDFIRCIWPFRALPERQFGLVIDMLTGKYGEIRVGELKSRISFDASSNILSALKGARMLLNMSGGTIPDRGYFDLRVESSSVKIGELDEEFVWERRVGNVFNLGTQNWRIVSIDSKTVKVAPVSSAGTMLPFWHGERPFKSFHLASKMLDFLEHADGSLSDESFGKTLEKEYGLDSLSVDSLTRLFRKQKEATGTGLPHRHRIIVEHVAEVDSTSAAKIVIHTFWGGRINRPFSFALAAAWETKFGYEPEIYVDDNSLLVSVPHGCTAEEIFSLLDPDSCETLIRRKLESTGFFGARFRENAGRALLLPKQSFPKRTPFWFTRLRSRKLFEATSRLADFPIILETWRTCMRDEFDIGQLQVLLSEIGEGTIRYEDAYVTTPSPFSLSSVWRETNDYMYRGDEPSASKPSNLDDDLFSQVIGKSSLRPRIEDELIASFLERVQRTSDGYSPGDPEELCSWVSERVLIPWSEWIILLNAMTRDNKTDSSDLTTGLSGKMAILGLPGAKEKVVFSTDNAGWIFRAFEINPEHVDIHGIDDSPFTIGQLSQSGFMPVTPGKENEYVEPSGKTSLDALLVQWLRFYGPVSTDSITRIFGDYADEIFGILVPSATSGNIVSGELSINAAGIEYCLKQNYERLLRLRRKQRRIVFSPFPTELMGLFLATWQGLTKKKEGPDALKSTLETLFGFPAHARLWEEDIFPSRVSGYRKTMLDSLLAGENLVWFGCGNKKLGYCLDQEKELFINRRDPKDTTGLFPSENGKFGFWDLAEHLNIESNRLTRILWENVWEGKISNTSFEAIRKGIANDFIPAPAYDSEGSSGNRKPVRSGFNRWKSSRPVSGLWYGLNAQRDESDEIDNENIRKDRVRQLLMRYGILVKPLTEHELPAFTYKALFRTLQIMELSGEILSGYFFEGVPGPQFVTMEAFELLKNGLDTSAIYAMNACDPASLCGTGLSTGHRTLPARVPTSNVICAGEKPAIVSRRNGAEADIFISPDDKNLSRCIDLFSSSLDRDFAPIQSIKIELINGERADTSPYSHAFLDRGFRQDYKVLSKRGSY